MLIFCAGVFASKEAPMTPRLWLLSLVVGVAPGLNNLSLQLNSVGLYTVAKLMVASSYLLPFPLLFFSCVIKYLQY